MDVFFIFFLFTSRERAEKTMGAHVTQNTDSIQMKMINRYMRHQHVFDSMYLVRHLSFFFLFLCSTILRFCRRRRRSRACRVVEQNVAEIIVGVKLVCANSLRLVNAYKTSSVALRQSYCAVDHWQSPEHKISFFFVFVSIFSYFVRFLYVSV